MMAAAETPQCFGSSLRLPWASGCLKSDHKAHEKLSSPKEQPEGGAQLSFTSGFWTTGGCGLHPSPQILTKPPQDHSLQRHSELVMVTPQSAILLHPISLIEVNLVESIIPFQVCTLKLDICTHYRVVTPTTINIFSTHHHTTDPLPPLCPFPPLYLR